MADMNIIADGRVKYRDGKKWKLRWCAVRMPSPVADRLQVYLYKDCKDALKDGNAKNTFPLEGFYGIESGFTYEKEDNVMAIICQKSVILMSFESRELMIHFELRIRRCLGEEHQYRVRILKVPQGSKLPLENVRMHIHHDKFCLAAYIPPKMLQSWRIHDLRRFGVVEGKFVFEGGSRCRKGSGVHIIATEQGEEVAEIFQAASEGKPTAGERKWPVMLRRSQINEFLDSPFKSQYSDTPSSASSIEMDSRSNDSEWRKRHSISAADYGWAQGYGEKNKLISIENLENEARDHLLAIYDIPPRRIRKVEFLSPNRNSLQPSPNRNTLIPHLTEGSTNAKLNCVDNSKNYYSNTSRNGNQYHSFESFMPSPTNGNTHYENEITMSAQFSGGSVIDTEIDRATTQTRRQDAQNKLHKEEQNLQREITLLDEMLQVWQLEETKPNGGQTQPKYVVSMQGQPALPNKKSYQNTNAWVDANFTDNEVQFRSNSCSLNNTTPPNRTGSGYWDSGMLSPNLLSKLNKIPQNSQLAAPLPYVNLEKYDAGDDRRHLSVSSSESSDILLPTDTRSQNYDNLNLEHNQPPLPAKSQQLIDYHNNVYFSQQDSKTENISQNINSPKTEEFSREYSPPPKLPPKGPLLQNRNRQRQLLPSANNPVSPVPHISRRHTMSPDSSSSSDLSPYHMPQIGNPSSVRLKDQDNNCDDSYFMMSGFAKEEKCEESDLLKSPVLPHGNSNMIRAYMDMTGKFEIPTGFPPPPCPSTHNSPGRTSIYDPNITQCCAPPPPLSTMPAEMMRSQPIATGNPDENYMEMGGSPKKSVADNLQASNLSICSNPSSPTYFSKDIAASVSSDFSSSSSSSTNCNPVPFPNLKNFQMLNNEKSNEVTGSNQSINKGSSKDKPQENNMKAPGFFSRLIRRNSKDQTKNSSLSQENLASSNSPVDRTSSVGPPCNPETVENVESLPPDQAQLSGERQRSSSFPSENCYQDMVPELPKCNPLVGQKQTAGYPPLPFNCHRGSTSSCNPNSNNTTPTKCHNCQQSSLNQIKCNYKIQSCASHSTCQSPSKESHLDTTNQNLKQISSKSFESNGPEHYPNSDVSDSYIFMGPLFGKEEEMSNNEISNNSPTNNDSCTKSNLLTEEILPPEQFQTNNSSKTDDEKLLELYHLGKSQLKGEDSFESAPTPNTSELKDKLSLPLNPAITPDEQAAAIARHVAGLPPFIPPKTKSHPCSLSPVFESNPCLTPEPTGMKIKYEPEFQEIPEPFQLKDLSDYVQQKQQEQSSLRIAPASDPLVEETVWIPRTTDATEDESFQVFEGKQLKSNDASPQDEDSSVTPVTGIVESVSTEDAVRSSPASTILRPRSGKDYQLVERKKSIDGSSADTSNPQTPQSVSASLVFTFDNLPQVVSNNINNASPTSQNENPAYVNLGRDPDTNDPIFSYVNIDMTPPCSPFTSVDHPEPLLNYAEIDLSSNYTNCSNQMKATNPRDSIIDYATIDMVATVAAQKAGEEHAQSRGECFQASNRKYSSTNLSKESKSITGHLKEKKSSSISE